MGEGPSATADRVATLQRHGEYWTLGCEGVVVRVRDVKGLRYLAELVRQPGVERHAADLVSAVEGVAPSAAPADPALEIRADAGDAGALLDAEAKQAYRERLEDLRAEIEEAESFHDDERAAAGREEMDFLARELAAAVGLGGRDRQAGSTAERARVSVTRALRGAVRRVAEHDERLGRDLDLSLRTGLFCCFEPVPGFALVLADAAPEGEPARPVAPGALRLPARLAGAAATPFFGRARELERLAACAARARAGERTTVLVDGEPGIGKTRLLAEAAATARAAGMDVLYGRCDEELGLPYQPFVEAIGHLLEHGPPALAAHRETGGEALARVVPRLGGRAAGTSEPDRYMLFAEAGGLFAEAASSRPLLVVLDDLQWADKPTLLMLRYLATAPAAMSVLLAAAYRSTDVAPGHPLAALVADLRREPGVEHLELAGLENDDVAGLTAALAGDQGGSTVLRLAGALHAETSGNPFFVGEVFRHLAERGELVSSPDLSVELPGSVRETIALRVARRGEAVHDVLAMAAVLGREFDAGLLAHALGRDEDDVLDALDHAVAAGLIDEGPGVGPRYAFTHALVAQTLYGDLAPGRRRRAHRAVALALEEQCGDDPGPRIGELAHHVLAGAYSEDVPRALEYAWRAGDRALEQLAPDGAERWYGSALELLDRRPAGAARRSDLLTALGVAQCQSGNSAFRATLLEAAELARRQGDAERLARAGLANTRGFVAETGEVDAERVGVLEAALEAGTHSAPQRARLLAALAAELTFSGDRERRRALGDEALACAREAGEPWTLAEILNARFMAIWTPETLAERRANTEEALAIAEREFDPLLRFRAAHWRAVACVEAGDLDAAEALFAREAELAELLGQPSARRLAAHDRASVALMRGRLDDAEREIVGGVSFQLVGLRYEQGRLGELTAELATQAERHAAFRPALALARAEAGHLVAADEVPYDANWLVAHCLYAEASVAAGDARGAAALAERLEPWSDQVAFNGALALGLVERHLGNLAALAGRREEAERRLRAAAAGHERMGAPLWLARTRSDLAGLALGSVM